MRVLLVLCLTIFCLCLHATTIEELETALETASDKDKMSLHYQLAELYNVQGSLRKASENAGKAYRLAVKFDIDAMRARAALLDGQLNLKLGNEEKAIEILKVALKYAKSAKKETLIFGSMVALGDYYFKRGDYKNAIFYKDGALKIFQNNKDALVVDTESRPSNSSNDAPNRPTSTVNIAKYLAEIKELETEKKELLMELGLLRKKLQGDTDLSQSEKEDLLKELEDKKNTQQDIEQLLQKQSREIKELNRQSLENRALENQLRAEVAELELETSQFENLRNMGLAAGGFVLLILLFSWSRLRANAKKKKALELKNKEIEAEKERSDELLLNILPGNIANELKHNGKVKAQKFDQATVLFTDFVGFSEVSQAFSPEDLVLELDHCFKAFDYIIGQYNDIEKIKTIGDAYMCASGLTQKNTLPINIVKAALEMQQFMQEYKVDRTRRGKPYFEARIGLHTGSVVAGVVGFRKFVYDIWGPTVNIAARMESNSAPSRVNISHSTFRLIGHRFNCEYRGKIQAKNIGAVDSYFLVSEK